MLLLLFPHNTLADKVSLDPHLYESIKMYMGGYVTKFKQWSSSLLILFFLITSSGCTTLADVKAAKGEGEKGTYTASIDDVWDSVVTYINESSLDLVSEDKSSGLILAQRGINLANYGDNVAVFIESLSEIKTFVEVVHKKAMETNIFGAFWDKKIIKYLNEQYEYEVVTN